jgi:hypothetical protein
MIKKETTAYNGSDLSKPFMTTKIYFLGLLIYQKKDFSTFK